MITHFRIKPLYENAQLPGWVVTFYYKQKYYKAEYKKDGKIHWVGEAPEDSLAVKKEIHELMLYHVYE